MSTHEEQVTEIVQRYQRQQAEAAAVYFEREAAQAKRSHSVETAKLQRERRMATFRASVEADPDAHVVRKLRVARGWSARELGLRAGGVADSTIRDWEKGRREPLRSTAIAVARAFGMTINELRAADADA